jgi:glycine cleavage system aminomethyltransferase T
MEVMEIKKTELYQKHVELGAKMHPFAGYDMPVSYTTIKEEHNNVRNNVGVFDVSHMGEFIVEGKGAMHFIQSISSNNAARLNIGDAQYSCLPNEILVMPNIPAFLMTREVSSTILSSTGSMIQIWMKAPIGL